MCVKWCTLPVFIHFLLLLGDLEDWKLSHFPVEFFVSPHTAVLFLILILLCVSVSDCTNTKNICFLATLTLGKKENECIFQKKFLNIFLNMYPNIMLGYM